MNAEDLYCTVNVSTDWYLILDIKNKFNTGWKFLREDYIDKDRTSLVFERIYKMPEKTHLVFDNVELED